jgi:hypothetical protein
MKLYFGEIYRYYSTRKNAGVMKLANMRDSKSRAARLVGSSPTPGTSIELKGFEEARRWDARSACGIICFGNRYKLGKVETPTFNNVPQEMTCDSIIRMGRIFALIILNASVIT